MCIYVFAFVYLYAWCPAWCLPAVHAQPGCKTCPPSGPLLALAGSVLSRAASTHLDVDSVPPLWSPLCVPPVSPSAPPLCPPSLVPEQATHSHHGNPFIPTAPTFFQPGSCASQLHLARHMLRPLSATLSSQASMYRCVAEQRPKGLVVGFMRMHM